MRLISWNCQGAFRRKADLILSHNPDILVVQECEHPDKYVYNPTNKRPDSSYWYGDSRHKGICIHSFNDYKFELLPNFNPKFRYILPFRVTGHGQTFTLFAIWAISDVVDKLADNNIQSIYHTHFNIEQGKEKHPTFFLQRDFNKSYHIDYCFASTEILTKVQNIEIGTYENWIGYSDHAPLIIDFAL